MLTKFTAGQFLLKNTYKSIYDPCTELVTQKRILTQYDLCEVFLISPF